MKADAPDIELIELDRVELSLEPFAWNFAAERRADIDRHFAARRRARPSLWNGRVLLLHRYAIRDGVLVGSCFETDYASFLAWREWDFPGASVFHIFGSAALRAADGAYMVGEMAATTAGAGTVHFPCGSLDLADLKANGAVDMDGSLLRELAEETGIDVKTLEVEPGWCLVRDRGYLALMKRLTSRQNAEQLRSELMDYLRSDPHAEFSTINIVRKLTDLESRMPRFITAFFESALRQ